MLCGHSGALNDGQQIPLHPLAAGIRPIVPRLAGDDDLVDLVDEHDAVRLRAGEGLLHHSLLVDQPLRLRLFDQRPGLAHRHLLLPLLLARLPQRTGQGYLDLLRRVVAAEVDGGGHAGRGPLVLHGAVVQLALAQQGAERLAGLVARLAVAACQQVQQFLLHRVAQTGGDLPLHARARMHNGVLHQVADDLVHVSAVVPHLCELGGLDLDKGRIRQLGKATRNLRLAAASGADHQDVLRNHLLAKILLEPHAPPAVAQRHRHGLLRVRLADDELVQQLNHRGGRQRIQLLRFYINPRCRLSVRGLVGALCGHLRCAGSKPPGASPGETWWRRSCPVYREPRCKR
mmetsp:Transcript_34225/g.87542  ORF Transcript_34225/g.87542 Transcript_34225/m.87542 type:complete len:345 (+) Transcript_34225:789-1823(+)